MTLSEFQENSRRYRRGEFLQCIWLLAGFLLAGLPMVPIVRHIEHSGLDVTSIAMIVMLALCSIFLVSFGVIHQPRRTRERLGLNCPSCGNALVQLSAQIVVATGRCGFCGGQVLSP